MTSTLVLLCYVFGMSDTRGANHSLYILYYMAESMTGDGSAGDGGWGSGDDEEYETMTTGELLTKLEEVRTLEKLTDALSPLP